MNKEEYIAKYGKRAYAKRLANAAEWKKRNPDKSKAINAAWRKAHSDKIRASNVASSAEQTHPGGKYYAQRQQYDTTGVQGEKVKIRVKHRTKYLPYKKIVAPGSQLHHQWLPGSADYTGVALVEADQHMHGFIDVIEILEGKITLLTEAEIRNPEK